MTQGRTQSPPSITQCHGNQFTYPAQLQRRNVGQRENQNLNMPGTLKNTDSALVLS